MRVSDTQEISHAVEKAIALGGVALILQASPGKDAFHGQGRRALVHAQKNLTKQ